VAGLLTLAMLWLAAPVHAQEPGSAGDPAAPAAAVLQQLFDGVFAVSSSDAPGAHKRDAIESMLYERLDGSALTAAALGPLAERFSREEYADFSHAYVHYVTGRLVQRVADAEQPAHLVEAKLDAETGHVHALALGRDRRKVFRFQKNQPEGRSELRFTLRETHGEWRVAGLHIDAFDVSKSFRDQFASVLQREEPAALIQDLRRRNRELADADPFASGEK
jgi:ABC-type transporter MlaC component